MPVSEEVLVLIRKYAIKNAVDYGKAETGSVLGKVIKAAPAAVVSELKEEVQAAVSMVNKMHKADLEKEYAPLSDEFERRAKAAAERAAKHNLTIEGAEEGKVVTSFPGARRLHPHREPEAVHTERGDGQGVRRRDIPVFRRYEP